MSKIFPTTELTGGAFGALDAIDGALLGDGDGAIVIDPGTKLFYHYTLDATSGAAESSPDIIAPDNNPGTKRWILTPGPAINLDYMSFNINPTGVPEKEGVISWDVERKLPAIRTDIVGAQLNIGTEDWVRVRNQTGATIPDGTAVIGSDDIISPDTGHRVFLVVPAKAEPGPLAGITGITTNEMIHNAEGWAVTRGDVHDYDTRAFGPLDELFVSSLVEGELTNVAPSPPAYPIPIGFSRDSDENGEIYVFAQNPTSIIAAVNAAVASGDPTGFHDPNNILEEYDPVTRTITLTGSLKYSWRGQVIELTSPWTSDPHPAGLDVGYFLYSTDGENFTWSTSVWAFSDLQVAFVNYGTTDKYALREVHGLMNWQSHQEFHQTVGTYRISGGEVGGYVLASTTAADRRPTVAAMSVKDEDITTVNALLNSSLYTQGALTGAGIFDFTIDEPEIVPIAGAIPFFNEFVSPNWVQTPMSNNTYMSVWLVGVPATADSDSQDFRYMWIQGQTAGTLSSQVALFPEDLALGNLTGLFTEFVFSAKIILRYTGGNWHIVVVEDLTGTRARTTGSPSGNYLTEVTHDATLTGAGTVADPLSVVGGGGGAEWELIESRAMTGNSIELFDLTDDHIRLEFINVTKSGHVYVSLSSNGGSTFPNTHSYKIEKRYNTVATYQANRFTSAGSCQLSWINAGTPVTGFLEVFNIIGANSTHLYGRVKEQLTTYSSEVMLTGSFYTAVTVNKLKISVATTLSGGTMNIYKRLR